MAAPRSPFFAGVAQRELPIRQYRGKAPMFFYDARIAGAFFPVDLAAARALLPDPRLKAVVTGVNRGVLGVFACAYGDTDLGPYNEVFLAIGVQAGRSRLPGPVRTAGALLARSLDCHVVQLPVDSEAALFGGVDYYNVPKFMTAIEMTDADGMRTCTVRDQADGRLLYALRVPKPAMKKTGRFSPLRRQTLRNYSLLDGRLIAAKFELHMPELTVAPLAGGAALTIGDDPRSAVLAGLEPGRAVAALAADHAEAILHEPSFF